jgi:protein-S-isoprenylcysteine O-methyltransferase Ste14
MGRSEDVTISKTDIAPPQTVALSLSRLRQGRAYDGLMRLPMLAWAILLTTSSVLGLRHDIATASPAQPAAIHAVNLAMRLSTTAFCVLLVAMVVLRLRPTAQARGLEPRISALLGTLLISAIILFPRRQLPLGAEIASILLVAAGNALAVVALMQLGRSFSVMPEARRLVTSGPYRLVRHPLYLAEEIAALGILIQFLSGWTVLLCAAHLAFQLRRMRNEEIVLADSFPEYAAYSEATARLLPGIY